VESLPKIDKFIISLMYSNLWGIATY